MNLFHSRAEQLAGFLRKSIRDGKIRPPLLGRREWATQLGVSRTTLDIALQLLERDGLVGASPRKSTFLRPVRFPVRSKPITDKVVRLIHTTQTFMEYTYQGFELAYHLQRNGIRLVFERGGDRRIREICKSREATTLYLLGSFSQEQQKLFANSSIPAVLMGEPAEGVPLPCLRCDVEGAVCHATRLLLSRGYDSVKLLISRERIPAMDLLANLFETVCRTWPHQPIAGEVIRMSLDLPNATAEAIRLARSLKGRVGVVVLFPVSASLITTALLSQGVRIPEVAQIAAVLGVQELMKLCPPPIHYPFPIAALQKEIVRLVAHFYQTGRLPLRQKVLPLAMV